jgi:hypothetical protein
MYDFRFVSRRLPPHSTATLAALPAMSLIPLAPFRFQISDKRKAFVIAAVNDRDRKIISASRCNVNFFRLKPATAGKLIVCRLHNQRPALKSGFNGRNHHFYSSSVLRF